MSRKARVGAMKRTFGAVVLLLVFGSASAAATCLYAGEEYSDGAKISNGQECVCDSKGCRWRDIDRRRKPRG